MTNPYRGAMPPSVLRRARDLTEACELAESLVEPLYAIGLKPYRRGRPPCPAAEAVFVGVFMAAAEISARKAVDFLSAHSVDPLSFRRRTIVRRLHDPDTLSLLVEAVHESARCARAEDCPDVLDADTADPESLASAFRHRAGHLRSRTSPGRTSEVLCKVAAHNMVIFGEKCDNYTPPEPHGMAGPTTLLERDLARACLVAEAGVAGLYDDDDFVENERLLVAGLAMDMTGFGALRVAGELGISSRDIVDFLGSDRALTQYRDLFYVGVGDESADTIFAPPDLIPTALSEALADILGVQHDTTPWCPIRRALAHNLLAWDRDFFGGNPVVVSIGSERLLSARTHATWTKDEVSRLREMISERVSEGDMCLELGRTPASIRTMRWKVQHRDRSASGASAAAATSEHQAADDHAPETTPADDGPITFLLL